MSDATIMKALLAGLAVLEFAPLNPYVTVALTLLIGYLIGRLATRLLTR